MQVRTLILIFFLIFYVKLGHYAGIEDVFGVESYTPERIKKLWHEKTIQISSGYWHNLAVTGN